MYQRLEEATSSQDRPDTKVNQDTSRRDHHSTGKGEDNQEPEAVTVDTNLDRTEEVRTLDQTE